MTTHAKLVEKKKASLGCVMMMRGHLSEQADAIVLTQETNDNHRWNRHTHKESNASVEHDHVGSVHLIDQIMW
jgi:hypothetical protein